MFEHPQHDDLMLVIVESSWTELNVSQVAQLSLSSRVTVMVKRFLRLLNLLLRQPLIQVLMSRILF